MSNQKEVRRDFKVGDFISYLWRSPDYQVSHHLTGVITSLTELTGANPGYEVILGDRYTFEYYMNEEDEDMYVVEDSTTLKDRVVDKVRDLWYRLR